MRVVDLCVVSVALGVLVAFQASAAPSLTIVAESRQMIWNAVAVDDADRVYVASPRWTGSKGPSVAVLDASGALHPYPSAAWNTQQERVPPSQRFVNVNAIHRDSNGGLWVVDTGVTGFGGTVIPGGAKLVRIDLRTGEVTRVYPLTSNVAKAHSYVDDIRFNGTHAYLTDAGEPGLIVLDLTTGNARRALDGAPQATGTPGREIFLDGQAVRTADGAALKVNADPLEVSADRKWLYFASLEGPWWALETRWLDDPSLSDQQLQGHLEPWVDLPPVGGTTMDAQGNLYFTDLAANAVRRLTPDKHVQTVLVDSRLHWVDAPTMDRQGRLYLPVPQMDRAALFHAGISNTRWPVRLYRLDITRVPEKTP
jgi:sugar lactone lactonase YvrE